MKVVLKLDTEISILNGFQSHLVSRVIVNLSLQPTKFLCACMFLRAMFIKVKCVCVFPNNLCYGSHFCYLTVKVLSTGVKYHVKLNKKNAALRQVIKDSLFPVTVLLGQTSQPASSVLFNQQIYWVQIT